MHIDLALTQYQPPQPRQTSTEPSHEEPNRCSRKQQDAMANGTTVFDCIICPETRGCNKLFPPFALAIFLSIFIFVGVAYVVIKHWRYACLSRKCKEHLEIKANWIREKFRQHILQSWLLERPLATRRRWQEEYPKKHAKVPGSFRWGHDLKSIVEALDVKPAHRQWMSGKIKSAFPQGISAGSVWLWRSGSKTSSVRGTSSTGFTASRDSRRKTNRKSKRSKHKRTKSQPEGSNENDLQAWVGGHAVSTVTAKVAHLDTPIGRGEQKIIGSDGSEWSTLDGSGES